MTTMLWVAQSKNTKTGNIPQGYVGATRHETEASCDGCPMRHKGCYYWNGMPVAAHSTMQRVNAKNETPGRYSLAAAIKKSVRSARFVRGAVGGDPCAFPRKTVQSWTDTIKANGFQGLILYTHFAKTKGATLKGLALASTHSLKESDELMSDGWSVAYVAPFRTPDSKRKTLQHVPVWSGERITTPDGRIATVCPAQYKRGVNCNTCGLCSNHHKSSRLIAFLQH